MRRVRSADVGFKVIIAWKLSRAVVSLCAAASLWALRWLGVDWAVENLVARAHDHGAHQLSLELAQRVVQVVDAPQVRIVIVGLVLDAALLLIEAAALAHGKTWGRWLVIAATGSLAPFEVVALAAHPSVGRALLLAANLAIVGWLLWKMLGPLRRRRAHPFP